MLLFHCVSDFGGVTDWYQEPSVMDVPLLLDHEFDFFAAEPVPGLAEAPDNQNGWIDLALKSIYEDGFESAITCINNEYHMNTEISAWPGKSCAVYTSVWQNWFCSGTEGNSFASSVPLQITMLPNLEIVWAPSANIDGEFPRKWGDCQALKMWLRQFAVAAACGNGEVGGEEVSDPAMEAWEY
ncbi:hypothetical protein Tco_0281821 [Tanacetum coccineum]